MLFGIQAASAGVLPVDNSRLHLTRHQMATNMAHPSLSGKSSGTCIKGLGGINPGDLPGLGGGDLPSLPPLIGDKEYDIKCHLVYDESLFYASMINYIGGNGTLNASGVVKGLTLEPGTKDTEIKLSEGTYDFMVTFISYENSGPYPPQTMLDAYAPERHIMIENVTVGDDTELTFDIADATNYIEFSPVNHNGDPFRVSLLKIIEEAPGYEWDDSDANVWGVNFYKSFYNTAENDFIYAMRSNYGHRREDGRCGSGLGNFFINDVSDKYVFYQNVVAYDGDSNHMWTINLATYADGSKTVSNTSDEFSRFTQPIGKSNAFGKYPSESYYGAGARLYVGGNPLIEYGFFYDGADTPCIFMAQHNEAGSSFNTSTLAYPRASELAVYNESSQEWTNAGISGCAVALDNGTLRYDNPFNPYFNTPVSTDIVMGASTPVIYCPADPIDYDLKRPIMNFNPRFIGQHGEERDIDFIESGFEATYNGKTVCNSIEDFYIWQQEFADEEHPNGTVTLTLTDSNILIDDDITATNITEISYTEGGDDICPPVLQFVRFKQAFPEKYGPRLANQFGKVEFLAGDMNSNGYDTDYLPAEVNVEYAPHGSNEFTHLENTHLAQVNENRTEGLPVYITVLTDMNRKSPDGWFDFRFTISDDAGNKTVETLSPAVYIESLHEKSSIDNAFSSASRNDSETEYFDMTGRRVYTPAPGSLLIEKRGSDAALKIIK